MTTDQLVRLLAGTVTLLAVALAHFVSPKLLLLTCFVGVNLIQSSLTGFCPAGIVLKRFGIGSGSCCDQPRTGR